MSPEQASRKPRIKLCWTFMSMPELASMEPPARRRYIRSHAGRCPEFSVLANAAFLAMIAGGVIVSIIAGVVSLSSPTLTLLLIGCIFVTVPVLYQFTLLRVRAALRYTVMKAYRGERVPFCFNCGYDLRGVDSEHCPECGSRTRVPL